jgi:hypothetical protein
VNAGDLSALVEIRIGGKFDMLQDTSFSRIYAWNVICFGLLLTHIIYKFIYDALFYANYQGKEKLLCLF